jgi:hypothetical protein
VDRLRCVLANANPAEIADAELEERVVIACINRPLIPNDCESMFPAIAVNGRDV